MKKIMLDGIWNMQGNGYDCSGKIPGSVYSFLMENKLMPDPYYRQNELEATELLEHDYTFSRKFTFDKSQKDRMLLCCEGLDTICDIYINGNNLAHTENMHRSYEFDVTPLLKEENELSITFRSPNRFFREAHARDPLWGNGENTLNGYSHLRKSFCMSGWDWGPRLPDAGIWRSIYLLVVNSDRIKEVRILQRHENGNVFITPLVSSERGTAEVKIVLTAPNGEKCEIPEGTETKIENPQLWWPNGLGEQPLYNVEVTLSENGTVADKVEKIIGLRTLKLIREKDKYGVSFCHEVNGVRFFAMGADYVPEDSILSRITPERTAKLLENCKNSNFNAIRVWGGGNYPNDDFYDACDRLGLVVFHDLMVACAPLPDNPALIEEFAKEVRENLIRIRHHACMAVISGNNECEQCFSPDNITRLAEVYLEVYEDILPNIVTEVCPEIPYVSSSPSSCGHFIDPQNENVGDSHYWQVWHGDLPFDEYRKHYFRYLSEFGFESFPDEKTVNSFTLPSDRNVFSRVMEMHQRSIGANGKIISYLSQTYRYPNDFSTFIYASQLLQAEAIRFAVEHMRRNRGRCMGALYWQLNDIWPVASWASIDYFGRYKALQYAAKRFYSPVMISCRETGETTTRRSVVLQRDWIDYETKAQLSVNNDTMSTVSGTVRWRLCERGGEVIMSGDEKVVVPPLSVITLNEIDFNKTDIEHNYLWYEFDNGNSCGSAIFTAPKHFEFADPQLKIMREGNLLHIISESYAQQVNIYSPDEDFILSDNFFDMEKGERTVEILEGNPKNLLVRSVFDIR